MEITNFAHGVGQNSYHLVWKPKYSWDVFKFPWVRKDCEAILNEAGLRYNIKIYELEVMEDHVHIFVEIPPTMSVSKAMNLLKGFSAYKIFQKQPWLRQYFRKAIFGVQENFSEASEMLQQKQSKIILHKAIVPRENNSYSQDTPPFRAGSFIFFLLFSALRAATSRQRRVCM